MVKAIKRKLNLQIKIPEDRAAALEKIAAAKGLTPTAYGKMLIFEAIEKAKAA